jgi:hypothetical protein
MARTGTLVAIAACAAIAGIGVTGASYVGARIGTWQVGQNQSALTEAEMANRDHDKIVNAIEDLCEKTVRSPEAAATPANKYIHPISGSIPSGVGGSTSNSRTFQEAAINYSAEIRDRRISLDQQIRGNEARLWWFQVLVVLFGALATVAVGLKPLWERFNINYMNVAFAAGAIVFSALVTAVSSLSAFTTDQNEILHHQRTLAQLQQLHWRVGNDVFAATQLCTEGDLPKIESWKDRFEKIANDAMPTISQPEDLRNTQDPAEGILEAFQKVQTKLVRQHHNYTAGVAMVQRHQ